MILGLRVARKRYSFEGYLIVIISSSTLITSERGLKRNTCRQGLLLLLLLQCFLCYLKGCCGQEALFVCRGWRGRHGWNGCCTLNPAGDSQTNRLTAEQLTCSFGFDLWMWQIQLRLSDFWQANRQIQSIRHGV